MSSERRWTRAAGCRRQTTGDDRPHSDDGRRRVWREDTECGRAWTLDPRRNETPGTRAVGAGQEQVGIERGRVESGRDRVPASPTQWLGWMERGERMTKLRDCRAGQDAPKRSDGSNQASQPSRAGRDGLSRPAADRPPRCLPAPPRLCPPCTRL